WHRLLRRDLLCGKRRNRKNRKRDDYGEGSDAVTMSIHGIKCNSLALRIDVSSREWNFGGAVVPAFRQQQLVYRQPSGSEAVRRGGHVQPPDSVYLLSHGCDRGGTLGFELPHPLAQCERVVLSE